jgi:ectoine hydroxylase-related dioxygenase (phytanoyl-CoA dioxygenase family)
MSLENIPAREDLATHFRADGFVLVPSLFELRDIVRLNAAADRCFSRNLLPDLDLREVHVMRTADGVSRSSQDAGDGIRVALHLCHTLSDFRAHALSRNIAEVMRSLTSRPVHLYTDLLFNKLAEAGDAVELHQDAVYYREFECEEIISCWTALDDADANNGCLEYIPGSHDQLYYHRPGCGQALVLDADRFANRPVTAVPARAGDSIFHHGLTVHRSSRNSSNRRRRGLATIFLVGLERCPVPAPPFPIIALTS